MRYPDQGSMVSVWSSRAQCAPLHCICGDDDGKYVAVDDGRQDFFPRCVADLLLPPKYCYYCSVSLSQRSVVNEQGGGDDNDDNGDDVGSGCMLGDDKPVRSWNLLTL